eukprot:m51a1_g503 putative glucose-6-phosphate dehydrogenase (559) ;mRNA; r:284715-286634
MPSVRAARLSFGSGPSMSSDEVEKLRSENAKLLAALRNLDGRTATQRSPVLSNSPSVSFASGEELTTIVVLGASGDLAKKKIYPSLFNLKGAGLLPARVCVVGYARTAMSDEEFRKRINGSKEDRFPTIPNHYFSGGYDSLEDMGKLAEALGAFEKELGADEATRCNRVFYMAVPPSVFVGASRAIRERAWSTTGWNRIVVEKPFGRDLQSSRELQRDLTALFPEEAIFRIDHYLGKEMVQNLNVLRFGNVFLRPLWNREYISSVVISFKEDIGTEGRAGYFDNYGIIRDVMQNHLLQIMALVAMEAPVSLGEEDIRNEKVKVLRAVPPVGVSDIVVGQYEGYLAEDGVPAESVTPTFATAKLFINNSRWAGVPFILRCGKCLNERKAEIRIQFRDSGNYLFPSAQPNELVIRVQPNEAIYLKMMNKAPGMSQDLVQTELDLTLKNRFSATGAALPLPDAYEFLIRDAIRGDHSLFVRADELDYAWRIFTPALEQLERERVRPVAYAKGTRGPAEGDDLMRTCGFRYTSSSYSWPLAVSPGRSSSTQCPATVPPLTLS